LKGVIREAYYKEELHEDHNDNLKELLVIKALKKEHQDFIEGKQEVNKFMEALRTVIDS
jgi:hypothetical protein